MARYIQSSPATAIKNVTVQFNPNNVIAIDAVSVGIDGWVLV